MTGPPKEYDALIIGAGINGCGIALELSKRGHSVGVFDKGEIGGGTSSKSSRLIHGGLRYLEHLHLGLVYEALHDRTELVGSYPDLVSLVPFYLPLYQDSPRHPITVWTGLKLYDVLAGRNNKTRSGRVSFDQFEDSFPNIRKDRLRAVLRYYDGKTNDLDLTRRVAQDAAALGCRLYEQTPVQAVRVSDQIVEIDTSEGTHRAKTVINATGPWIDEVIERLHFPARFGIRKVSGIHLFLDGLLTPHPMFLQTTSKRIFFVIPEPEHDQTMVGTTEREETAPADDVGMIEADVRYLLDHLNRYLVPDARVHREDIKDVSLGIRPLVASRGDPTDLSREYQLDLHQQGQTRLLHVFGGKLTTFLSLSRKAANLLRL
jgi:glycerol-3-phosphate dehydrogenase